MRRPALLIAAGTAAFLAFLAAFLPASILLRFLPPEVQLSQVSGTVWRGGAGSVGIRVQPPGNLRFIGSLRWRNRPWRLALLELDYAVELTPPGGRLDMDVVLARGGSLSIGGLQGSIPLEAVEGWLAPRGWRGTAEFDIGRIEFESGIVTTARGTVVGRNVAVARPGGPAYGSFELELGEGAVGGDSVSGRVRDLGDGPMRVRATLEFRPDGSYLVSGEVAPGPDASATLLRDLAFLGPPDSLGRRPFTIEGTL